MSISRLFSVFVALALVVVAVLTIRAGIATSAVVSSSKVVLDQQERHPGFINLSAADSVKAAALAEQARLEFRRGEWNAGYNLYAPLDAHERHTTASTAAEQARLEFRRGEWYAGNSTASPEFDVEQARLQWRAGK